MVNDIGRDPEVPGYSDTASADAVVQEMTDEDLLDVAHDYFGIPVPDDSQHMARALRLTDPVSELFPPRR